VTTAAAVLLAVAAVAAVVDWYAVARDRRRIEYVCKPLVMVALIGVALTLEPANPARRAWFVAAGVFSLGGDVLLMLPRDRFIAGLASFLVAHLCYVAGFATEPLTAAGAAAGAVVMVLALALYARPLLRAVRRTAREVAVPLYGYIAAIGVMVVLALGSALPLAAAGALLFAVSDATLAWSRFVQSWSWARVAVMVTYQLGQAALVLSLLDRAAPG